MRRSRRAGDAASMGSSGVDGPSGCVSGRGNPFPLTRRLTPDRATILEIPRYDGRVIHTADIHERAGRSLWFVSGGQVLVALLGFASGVVLARRLSPGDFGLFAIATFVVVFVGMIADLGLHAALIQRQTELTTHDLRAAFALQQLAAALAFAVLWPVTSL